MKPYSELSSTVIADVFGSVHTAVMIIDNQYHVKAANAPVFELLGINSSQIPESCTCYQLLLRKSSPCKDCPLNGRSEPFNVIKSLTIETGTKQIFVKNHISFLGDYAIFSLQDISRELNLIRSMELGRKKLTAQNVLINQRYQKSDRERHSLTLLLDHLPDAVITVDESLKILQKNKAVHQILNGKDAQTCYQIFGHDEPCHDCPVTSGLEACDGCKKSHRILDRYFTEILTPSPFGSGALILFRDSTRQIQLIEQIRQQQETIKQKNAILTGLVKLSSVMQTESDLKTVLEFFIGRFLSVMNSDCVAIFVNDIRSGNLWLALEKGLNEFEMKDLARAYLSRDMQTDKVNEIPGNSIPWPKSTQVPLLGGNARKVGIIILKGEFNQQEELIGLYSEPLGAHIHNRLLMRQLEEKANTDAMTGLYNRGYIEQALMEEQQKLEKYNLHYSVVVVDVNRLKMANDIYGHEAGDLLIQTVADLLKRSVRSTDIVARTGGDEFLILLANTTDSNAGSFAHRLINFVFCDISINVGNNEKFPVTVSVGTAGSDRYFPQDLVKEADRLMYQHKEDYYKTHKRYR